VWLLEGLGHEARRRGRRWCLPGLGLTLWEREDEPADGRFGGVSLTSLHVDWGSRR
jgi:hypothetical protein